MPDNSREVPPTAGLPLEWRDFVPRPSSQSLDAALAALLGVRSVQIECSGTAALIVALEALKQGSRRRSVIIPAYTCPLVVFAVLHCGLIPRLCDVRRNHFELSPESLESLADEDTLAIIPTHLGGRVAEMAAVVDLARKVGAAVIEDAAQALGATWQGRAVGTIGDAGFYSLAVGKGLTLYEGGVLIAHDEALSRRFRDAGNAIAYKPLWEIRRLVELIGYATLYRPRALRLAYGLPLRRALRAGNLIAAVGDDFSDRIPLHRVGSWRKAIGGNAVNRLPAFLETLSDLAATRGARLGGIRGLTLIGDPEGGRGTWPYFVALMPSERARDEAMSRLWTAGAGVSRLFIHALPDYPYLAARFDGPQVANARDFAARMLTITNSPWLRDAEFQWICEVLEETIAESNSSLTR